MAFAQTPDTSAVSLRLATETSSDKTITKPTLAPARAFGRVFPIVFVYVLASLSTFHSLEMFENGAFLTGEKRMMPAL